MTSLKAMAAGTLAIGSVMLGVGVDAQRTYRIGIITFAGTPVRQAPHPRQLVLPCRLKIYWPTAVIAKARTWFTCIAPRAATKQSSIATPKSSWTGRPILSSRR